MTLLADCDRAELAVLVPEYLLAGHLIDRVGMPLLIARFGMETMRDIAIDEWMGASPVYTRRMQRALRFEGSSVETIFKGLQLDIGAPPQFMDFRYRLDSADRGEFWLAHCGALMDVEPMGEEFVVAMCHDIEDPTFDATAIATNPRARIRPIHRPPRVPADQNPHCHWTVTISDDVEPLPLPRPVEAVAATRAATLDLAAPDRAEPGASDYAGPLLTDLQFADWGRTTLLRIGEEVCLQGHLLVLSFIEAVRARAESSDEVVELTRGQFIGAAGIAARRLRAALNLGGGLDAVAVLLELHPALLPRAYTECSVMLDDRLVVELPSSSPAVADGAWPALLEAEDLAPLDAIVREVDARYRCETVDQTTHGLTVEVVMDDLPAKSADEVALAAFSTGAEFAFEQRGAPVAVRRSS